MSYTKEPWMVHSTASEALAIYAGFRRVATVPHSDREGTAEDEANAKLIAAAPELLEALTDCKGVLDSFEQQLNGKSIAVTEVLTKARAAIAKATEGV